MTFDPDNPDNQTLTFPVPTASYDLWTNRRVFHEVSQGAKVAHLCPECVIWWGCQADPCDTPRIAACWLCVQIFEVDDE